MAQTKHFAIKCNIYGRFCVITNFIASFDAHILVTVVYGGMRKESSIKTADDIGLRILKNRAKRFSRYRD